ncbi:hypothetical protein [Rhizorhapis sp.]|uniref:hypothetical protein n=1 Tax=Rhizorhapis sp. TaxID=1968842 RepID=UPI002B4862D7|nr:hypothetical protein [Rhizorhapis sp.]HKR17711.1 hypothetical protein [Rhizorhapis sp.]
MQNNSGIEPLDTKCLVLPDPVEEKTSGGIILSDVTKEKEAWKRQKCTLIARGASAFADWGMDRPKTGDRIFVAQYSGAKIEADDGQVYWIINDEDIIGKVAA